MRTIFFFCFFFVDHGLTVFWFKDFCRPSLYLRICLVCTRYSMVLSRCFTVSGVFWLCQIWYGCVGWDLTISDLHFCFNSGLNVSVMLHLCLVWFDCQLCYSSCQLCCVCGSQLIVVSAVLCLCRTVSDMLWLFQLCFICIGYVMVVSVVFWLCRICDGCLSFILTVLDMLWLFCQVCFDCVGYVMVVSVACMSGVWSFCFDSVCFGSFIRVLNVPGMSGCVSSVLIVPAM